jgi:hypothetical protein
MRTACGDRTWHLTSTLRRLIQGRMTLSDEETIMKKLEFIAKIRARGYMF